MPKLQTPGTEAKASSGWKWVWVLVGLEFGGVSSYTPPPREGAVSSRATDAPLFLQLLFKGLIDRLGGTGVGGWRDCGGWVQLREAGLRCEDVVEASSLLWNAEWIKASDIDLW